MKKLVSLFLVSLMALSIVAYGNKTEEADTLTDVEVNGVETTVKDFLVENLNAYTQKIQKRAICIRCSTLAL